MYLGPKFKMPWRTFKWFFYCPVLFDTGLNYHFLRPSRQNYLWRIFIILSSLGGIMGIPEKLFCWFLFTSWHSPPLLIGNTVRKGLLFSRLIEFNHLCCWNAVMSQFNAAAVIYFHLMSERRCGRPGRRFGEEKTVFTLYKTLNLHINFTLYKTLNLHINSQAYGWIKPLTFTCGFRTLSC